jgi:hypothetical protein
VLHVLQKQFLNQVGKQIDVRSRLKLSGVPVGCGSGFGETCCLVVGGHRSMCWLYL